ncbi:MAG: sulfate ABC transporter permease [Cyclobacteriaceae bacterium]|nr:sulfate ABC transporter permease [Cyclobacteriaceae bacterium HetDA_MAG_MS6]
MKWLVSKRQVFFQQWYNFNAPLFFVMLVIVYAALFILKRIFIIDEIAAFEVLEERGEIWVLDIFFGLQYFVIPLYLAWKFTITAFLIWTGCFMFGYRVTYNSLWRWVMFAELIFLIPEFLKLLWFTVIANDPTYHEYSAFYPLSLQNLVNTTGRWLYPLKTLNLFEFFYSWFLAVGVFYLSKKKWKISVLVVLTSYTLFFFIWLGLYLLGYK